MSSHLDRQSLSVAIYEVYVQNLLKLDKHHSDTAIRLSSTSQSLSPVFQAVYANELDFDDAVALEADEAFTEGGVFDVCTERKGVTA